MTDNFSLTNYSCIDSNDSSMVRWVYRLPQYTPPQSMDAMHEMERDAYWGNNLAEKYTNSKDKFPCFYGSPKYVPEINLMPGANSEYIPIGSLDRYKKRESDSTCDGNVVKNDHWERQNISLKDTNLPQKLDPTVKIINLDDSPVAKAKDSTKDEAHLKVESKLYEGKENEIGANVDKNQENDDIDPHIFSQSWESNSDEDIDAYLEDLSRRVGITKAPAKDNEDAESAKDYDLGGDSSPASCNDSESDGEGHRQSKSQEIHDTQRPIVKKRHGYKMFDSNEKAKAVKMAQKLGVKQAAEKCNVPVKSLKRWMIVGCSRAKGGGRKPKDPEMEKKVFEWYCEESKKDRKVSSQMIRDKALEFSNFDDFKASKGWLDIFKRKYLIN